MGEAALKGSVQPRIPQRALCATTTSERAGYSEMTGWGVPQLRSLRVSRRTPTLGGTMYLIRSRALFGAGMSASLVCASAVGVFVTLPVDGIVGADDSDIWIDNTSLDFGTVIVGMQAGGAAPLLNGGDPYGPIAITGGEPPDSGIRAAGDVFWHRRLVPGGGCSIGFGFRPSGGGHLQRRVDVHRQ